MAEHEVSPGDAERAREQLGERLRRRREELDLTQTDIGTIAGVSRTTMRAVETGKPVEARTLANVKRALGCSPGHYYRTPEDSRAGVESLRSVLSVGATRILALALVRAKGADRMTLVSDYFDLVNALSEVPPDLPATLHRFWDALQATMAPADIQFLDSEIQTTLSNAHKQSEPLVDKYEPSLSSLTPREQLPQTLAGAIVQSGLPPAVQQLAIGALTNRQAYLRDRLEYQLGTEAGLVVRYAREAIETVAKAMDMEPDSEQVQKVAAELLPLAIGQIFTAIDRRIAAGDKL